MNEMSGSENSSAVSIDTGISTDFPFFSDFFFPGVRWFFKAETGVLAVRADYPLAEDG